MLQGLLKSIGGGVVLCVESYVGAIGGAQGVRPEQKVVLRS